MSKIENLTSLKSNSSKGLHLTNANVSLATTYNDNQKSFEQSSKISNSQVLKLYAVSDLSVLLVAFSALSFFAGSLQLLSFAVVSAAIIITFERSGHYRLRTPFWSELKNIFNVMAIALLVDSFFHFASGLDSSRFIVIAGWIFAGVSIVALRALVRKLAIKQGKFEIPTILVGSGSNAQQTEAAINSAPEMGYNIVAHIKNLPEAFMQAGNSWVDLCGEYGARHVIFAFDGKDLPGTEKIVTKLMRESIDFTIVPALQNIPVAGMKPQYFMNHNTMFLTHDAGLKQYLPQSTKRVVDVLVSGTALLFLSPIMLVIAAIVKLDGGDAFFGHKRLGKGGKIFPCLKFRSMVMGGDKILKKHLEENPEAAAEWKATQKLQNDPRVTKIGAFLRKTSIDELPQLINVLKGEMSLVGPRPIVRDEVEHYAHDIAYYYRVRPGVTGLWQVSGRNDVSYAQRVQMDSWYVRNWSLWHDIAIIFKTFPAVFKRNGAY